MNNEPVKIFKGENKKCDNTDTESLLSQMHLQKENGNIEKARKLGDILADECISNDGEFEFGFDEIENNCVILQRRLLLAFTIQHGLQQFCPNTIVEKTAANQFFTIVEEKAPHIYENIQENGAFSYYTLCVRQEERCEECIGQTFAELSGHKEEEPYQQLGKALFLYFLDLIQKKAGRLDFQ